MLYNISKPFTTGTVGNVKLPLQVLEGAVIVGAVGNITTLTVFPAVHAPGPGEPAIVLPQSADKTYRA